MQEHVPQLVIHALAKLCVDLFHYARYVIATQCVFNTADTTPSEAVQ
jgi:hypothetical protein